VNSPSELSQSLPAGFLNVLKPSGMTSHDVVAVVRRFTGKTLKVGHLGTLDPAASGVLPIAIGAATRWISFAPPARKQYVAEITLGLTSDTHDGEGEVVPGGPLPEDASLRLGPILEKFSGTVMQHPPQVSAIRVAGKRGYERVRAGEEFELAARPAHYHQIRVLRADLPRLWLQVDCGPGTYIRALARDIGLELGCGGLLSALLRTRSGRFRQAEAILLEELADWRSKLLPVNWPWLEQPALSLDPMPQGLSESELLARFDAQIFEEPRWSDVPGLRGVVQRINGKSVLVKRA
jgi:tRNA pseudouridine55 synthase